MTAFERVQGRRIGYVEGIKSAAQHERDFVDQHVADGPQFAGEAGAVRAAAGRRKTRGRRRTWRIQAQPAGDRRSSARCACASSPASTATPTGSARARKRLALREPARERHDDRARPRNGQRRRRQTPTCPRRSRLAATTPSDVHSRVERADMNAAFGLAAAAPAAGALVLARPDGAGAGQAADRGKALGDQRMPRQAGFADIA